LGAASAFASAAASGFAPSGRAGVVNRSRNWSSRNFGSRGVRSMRATMLGSVRWLELNRINLPSLGQEMELPKELDRKLTGFASPPSAGTTNTLVKFLLVSPR